MKITGVSAVVVNAHLRNWVFVKVETDEGITGWGEAVGSHEQKAAGVDWVVAKPFTADRIAELVRDIDSAREKSVATAAA